MGEDQQSEEVTRPLIELTLYIIYWEVWLSGNDTPQFEVMFKFILSRILSLESNLLYSWH